ncbi:MAG TPA: type II secretion system protein [Candidatus Saccharimonadales bacterium]|nr:type II secretion system protein [Candidatus Saccharimonadales bacterium]
MKNVLKRQNQKGFTIIEIMIVLTIAAVILLIVFLAVPALQRSSRNTQRSNDAASIASAINQCLANQNGLTGPCQSTGANNVDIDFAKLGQLTAATYSNSGAMGSTTSARWSFAYKCNGNVPAASATTPKSLIVTFQLEASGGGTTDRCLES